MMHPMEQVQYKAALIVSGCWQGTNGEKLYEELGWKSLCDRRWCRRLCLFHKILNGITPSYLADFIPQRSNISLNLRNRNLDIACRTARYSNSFFPFCITNWNSLDESVRLLPSISQFKSHLFKFVRPPGFSFYGVRDRIGSKWLTQIRVGFSDLREHRFNHNFNCENPTCFCGIDDETPVHYFLCCPRYNVLRVTYLGKISDIIGNDVTVLPREHLYSILIYGRNTFNDISNKFIISATIQFLRQSGRFKELEAPPPPPPLPVHICHGHSDA